MAVSTAPLVATVPAHEPTPDGHGPLIPARAAAMNGPAGYVEDGPDGSENRNALPSTGRDKVASIVKKATRPDVPLHRQTAPLPIAGGANVAETRVRALRGRRAGANVR